jgi:hypothetical protein
MWGKWRYTGRYCGPETNQMRSMVLNWKTCLLEKGENDHKNHDKNLGKNYNIEMIPKVVTECYEH